MSGTYKLAETIFMKYFRTATGIDLSDQKIHSVDVSKITLAEAWDTACWEITLNELTLSSNVRIALGLLALSNSPIISKSQKENCIIGEDAIKYSHDG